MLVQAESFSDTEQLKDQVHQLQAENLALHEQLYNLNVQLRATEQSLQAERAKSKSAQEALLTLGFSHASPSKRRREGEASATSSMNPGNPEQLTTTPVAGNDAATALVMAGTSRADPNAATPPSASTFQDDSLAFLAERMLSTIKPRWTAHLRCEADRKVLTLTPDEMGRGRLCTWADTVTREELQAALAASGFTAKDTVLGSRNRSQFIRRFLSKALVAMMERTGKSKNKRSSDYGHKTVSFPEANIAKLCSLVEP